MASRVPGSLFPLGRTIPELLSQWMPSPENQECEGGTHRVPAQDPHPSEPSEAPLRQNRRAHHEPELEQEEREPRPDHQTAPPPPTSPPHHATAPHPHPSPT